MSDLAAVDLNLLVALDALLVDKNVTRAASRLGVTQSAASHSLSRLREAFGDPLLVRRGSVMVTTPLAEEIAPKVRAVVASAQSLLRDRGAFDPTHAQVTFRISASDYVQLVVLPALVERLEREATGIDLFVRTSLSPERTLGDGTFDFAFAPSRGDVPSSLQRRKLFSDRLVVLARQGHPLLRRELTLDKYLAARHALVAPRETRGGIVDDALRDRGLSRRVALTVPHFLVAPMVVASTSLLVTLPERLARALAPPHGLEVRPLPLDVPPLELLLYWHERSGNDPAHRWFRGVVADVARTLNAS